VSTLASSKSVLCSLKPQTIYPFDPLLEVLERFPVLRKHARFLLVPGPSDPASLTASFTLPRDPLPAVMLPPALGGGLASKGQTEPREVENDGEAGDSKSSLDEEDSGVDETDEERQGRTRSGKGQNEKPVAEVIRGSNPCRVKYAGQYLIFYRGDTQAKFLRYALNVPLANAEDVPRFEQVHFQFSKQLLLRSPVDC